MKKSVMPNDVDNNIEPYKYDKFSKIPSWVKIFFLKFWAAGAAVFFFGIGGSLFGLDYSYIDMADDYSNLLSAIILYILLTLGLALFMTYIVGIVVRYMKSSRDNTYRFNMINVKGFLGFLLNLVYAALCMIPIVLLTILFAQIGMFSLFGSNYGWGLEPFTMGFLYLVIDGFFLLIKNSIIYIIKRVRYNKDNKSLNAKI